MKVTKAQIDSFLEKKKLAVAGVSRNEKKFGYQVFRDLKKNGFEVLPINPNTKSIDGNKCYASVEDIPQEIDSLLILTPKYNTDEILRKALKKGIKNIWIQQASNTNESLKIAEEFRQEIIYGKCIYMFADPVRSIHKFHRNLTKVFGQLPK